MNILAQALHQAKLLWWQLTQPSPALEGDAEQSEARLLASLSLALSLFTGLRLVLGFVTDSVRQLGLTGALVGLSITLLGYGISRSRWYGRGFQAAVLGLAFLYPLVVLRFQNLEASIALIWFVIPLLLGNLFLPSRGMAVLGLSVLVVLFTIPLWWGFPLGVLVPPAILLTAVTLFLMLLQRHRHYLERRRQAALVASEERLIMALNAAQMGIWHWDVPTNQVEWSPRVYELMEVAQGEPVSFERYRSLIHAEDWPMVEKAIAGVMSGREPNYHIEHRLNEGTGQTRWLEAQGRLYRDAQGNPLRLTGMVRDITERKLTELQLKQSEEKFYKAFHTTSAAMMMIHIPTGLVVEANEAFYEISGLMADQVLQHNIADIGFWHEPEQRTRATKLMLQYGRLRHFEMRFATTSGFVGYGLLSAEIIELNHERYFLGVMLDMTEQRQGEIALTQQAEQLQVLHQTAVELTHQLDLPSLLQMIIRRACQLVEVKRGGVFMATADGQAMELVATNDPTEQIYVGTTLKKGDGLAGQVLQTGQAISLANYKAWAHHHPDHSVAQVGRALAIPLTQGAKVIGSLNVFDEQEGEFPYHIRTVLEMFAAYAAVAIRNAQLFTAEQRQRETAETLRDIGRVVGSSLELNQVLDLALEQIERVVAYDCAHFMLLDEEENTHLVAARRYFRQEEMMGTVIPLQELYFSHQAVKTGQPVVVGDTAELPAFNPVPAEAKAIRSMLLVPLGVPERPLGVLSLLSLRPYQFGEQEQFLATQFAQQVMMAVENARLHQELKEANTRLEERVAERTAELARAKVATEEQRDQLATLNSIIQAVSRATDLRTALHSMTQSLTELLRASFSIVAFFNEERTELVILPRLNLPQGQGFHQMRLIPAVQTILQRQESLIITRTEAERLGAFGRYVFDLELSYVLLIPLLVRGQLLGVVAVASRAANQPFTAADVQLGETVAAQVAGIIEQFRLLEAEYEARLAAEGANRAKSAFLASMSHELRTPLNSVLGFTQVLRRSPNLDAEEKEQLAIVQASGEHLLELINEVLDMSKIEAGQMALQKHPFVVGRMLKNLEGMFSARAEAKGLQFRLETTADLPSTVVADERRLTQVLINLLENALKFTSQGAITLRVATQTTPHQTILHFSVADTGIGIGEQELPLLFMRFSQTSSGRQSQQGTGLGLALSQQLVRLLGGEIRVESVVGEGSRFYFAIPVEQALLLPEELENNERTAVGLAEGQPTYRILVVEDLYENSLLLRKVLEPLGFEVTVASNGQEGVALWRQEQPHLILMDMQMPIMDGYEATRQIRALAGAKSPIIIALTASAYETERAAILANGCDDFMSKPFRTADLLAMLGKHLGVRYVYAEPEQAKEPTAVLSAAVLRQLPASWRNQLYTAAIAADQRQIGVLAEQVAGEYAAVASALQVLISQFATAELIPLLEQAAEGE